MPGDFDLNEVRKEVSKLNAIVGTLWEHKATRNPYHLVDVVIRESDGAILVTYVDMHGVRWSRPADEFFDGRFDRIDE